MNPLSRRSFVTSSCRPLTFVVAQTSSQTATYPLGNSFSTPTRSRCTPPNLKKGMLHKTGRHASSCTLRTYAILCSLTLHISTHPLARNWVFRRACNYVQTIINSRLHSSPHPFSLTSPEVLSVFSQIILPLPPRHFFDPMHQRSAETRGSSSETFIHGPSIIGCLSSLALLFLFLFFPPSFVTLLVCGAIFFFPCSLGPVAVNALGDQRLDVLHVRHQGAHLKSQVLLHFGTEAADRQPRRVTSPLVQKLLNAVHKLAIVWQLRSGWGLRLPFSLRKGLLLKILITIQIQGLRCLTCWRLWCNG